MGGGEGVSYVKTSFMSYCRFKVEAGIKRFLTVTLSFWEQQQQQQYCREGKRFRICNQAPVPPCSPTAEGSVQLWASAACVSARCDRCPNLILHCIIIIIIGLPAVYE